MHKKRFFIETYGCQMNFADSEIVTAILAEDGHHPCDRFEDADLILINTCSIRDNAEQRVLNRLDEIGHRKRKNPSIIVGVLGCMAERLKEELIERRQAVDLVVGPDAYRHLPDMLVSVQAGSKETNVILSEEETYAEIEPIRLDENKISAFISIMRGCENYCAYCVVPYTRGKERSRDPKTILHEAQILFDQGYREITLLGQNVNSYRHEQTGFPELMDQVAQIDPRLRIRFATSHPKDLNDHLLEVMATHPNICRSIHLPIQSGSSSMLQRMKRRYDRAWYLERIAAIRRYLPDCSLSTDIIAGFCGESETEHQETLSLMREVAYEFAFMFKYSERPNTFAAKNYADDIPEAVKLQRLNEIIQLQQACSLESNQRDIGKCFEILVEGPSKRSNKDYCGRNSQNKVIIFAHTDEQAGDYIQVRVTEVSSVTLKGQRV